MKIYNHLSLREYLAKLLSDDESAANNSSAWNYIFALTSAESNVLAAVLNEVYGNSPFLSSLTFWAAESPYVESGAEGLFIRLCAEYAEQILISYPEGEFESVKYSALDEIIMRLDNTFPKYNALFSAYNSTKNKLLDGLTRHTIGETGRSYEGTDSQSATGQEKSKDTPQTSITLGDGYNSNVRDSSMENSTEREWEETGSEERTETYDVDSVIDKLSKLEEKYAKLWEKWLGEFKEFFLSKYNIGD